MKVLSLFSGVGGFDLGLERVGMETVFQCEWDRQATAILEKHWPDVPKWGDITTLTGAHILQHAPVIDVVAWGSPCQDMSAAGKRAGLGGDRSIMFYEGIRIIKEIRELTNGQYPRISIWENVAGSLWSGGGADFGQVLNEMDEAGACFSEWRVLDAQYFGVPQRRRRVFLVSVFDSATAARCPDPLLPVSEGVRGHIETSQQAGETVARPNGQIAGVQSQGTLAFDTQFGSNANVTEEVAPCLKASQQAPSVVLAAPTDTVRRFTPLECERLMGWPDEWTAGQADTPRYKQCGNGVASPVAQWIGQQLMRLDA